MDLRLVVGGTLVLAGLVAPLILDLEPTVALAGSANEALADASTGAAEGVQSDSANAPSQREAVSVPLIVEHRVDDDGMEYATVIGTNVSLFTVVRRLAESSGRLLFGFEERALSAPLVTLELRDRPLEEVLEYALGGAGLIGELAPAVLQVRPDTVSGNREMLLVRALAGFSRSTIKHPEHALTPAARLNQGEIEELRGNGSAALGHYQLLIEAHPSSALILEAHLRTGYILEQQGQWNMALAEFSHVAEISPETFTGDSALMRTMDEYTRTAKLEIARCNLELGRAEFALLIISVLDTKQPSASREEHVERQLLSARAYLAGHAYMQSLTVLDELQRGFVPTAAAVKSLEILARCFEGLDLRKEAALAWLTYARQVEGAQSAASYERAAELFLALEDYLHVLFVAGEVEATNSTADVATEERMTRAALGLAVELSLENSSVQERFEAATRAAQREDWDYVATLLAPLFARIELAPLELRDDIVIACAGHALATQNLDAALAVLRTGRTMLLRIARDDVPRLDGYAGQLLEQRGLYERAIDAYEGHY